MTEDIIYPYDGLMYMLMGGKDSVLRKKPLLESRMPPELERVRGFRQHESHGGLDPVDHTFNVLYKELNTSRIPNSRVYLVNVATLFHDCGKKDTTDYDLDHPVRSAQIWMSEVAGYTGLPEDQIIDIACLIAQHTALARFVGGKLDEEGLVNSFYRRKDLFDMHHVMIVADIRSRIPFANGCGQKFLAEVENAYASVSGSKFFF